MELRKRLRSLAFINASTQTNNISMAIKNCIETFNNLQIEQSNQYEKMSNKIGQSCSGTLEYEELVLQRNFYEFHKQPFGITLCYDNCAERNNETFSINYETNIFIASVEANSVAGRDGRIHVGDQILQINGVSIHSRKDALLEFSKPSCQVRLLLARSQENDDDNECENNFKLNNSIINDNGNLTADLKCKTLKFSMSNYDKRQESLKFVKQHSSQGSLPCRQTNTSKMHNTLSSLSKHDNISRNLFGDKATDSGMSRGTDSEEHDGLINLPSNSPTHCFTLEKKLSIPQATSQMSRLVLEESLEEDLAHLHREMETIRFECDRLLQRHSKTNVQHKSAINTTKIKQCVPQFNKYCEIYDQCKTPVKINGLTSRDESINVQHHKNSVSEPKIQLQQFEQQTKFCNKLNNKQNCEKKLKTLIIQNSTSHQLPKECEKMNHSKFSVKQQISPHQVFYFPASNQLCGSSNISSTQNFVEETSSSAYNTGGDSCRSTPMNYAENTDTNHVDDFGNTIEYQVLIMNPAKRPKSFNFSAKETKNNFVVQASQNFPSPENFYHTIDTPTPSTLITTTEATIISPTAQKNNTTQFRLPKLFAQLKTTASSQTKKPVQNDNINSQTNSSNNKTFHRARETMYTSAEKLAETIAYQQRLLREAMIGEAQILSEAATQLQLPKPNQSISPLNLHTINRDPQKLFNKQKPPIVPNNLSLNKRQQLLSKETKAYKKLQNDENAEPQFEWKIKRRPDGTRYITRRPLRSQIMKAREEEVNRERFALSTDDDATSELKVGRFWSRNDRKRHLDCAKQHKIKHLKLLSEKSKNAFIGSEKRLLQLSHAKQNRKNKQCYLDKFTTIQELLAHGLRGEHSIGANILSVTTV